MAREGPGHLRRRKPNFPGCLMVAVILTAGTTAWCGSLYNDDNRKNDRTMEKQAGTDHSRFQYLVGASQ